MLAALGELVAATGVAGMVGGQYRDVTAGEELDADGLRELHELKTGRLVGASVLVPLALAGVDEARMVRTAVSRRSSGSCFRSSTTFST